MSKEFYSSTINGVELKVKFAFRKSFFTKNTDDINKRIYFDVGVLVDIGWNTSTSASPKYALNMINAMDISSGMAFSQGQMTFKTFHKDSLETLKEEILKGINGGKDQMEFPVLDDNPFITLEDENKELIFETHSDHSKINWSQMPLFDIILISQASKENNQKELRIKEIQSIKITSKGFAESLESLEMNSMCSFMAIGKITDWEEVIVNEQ